MLQLIPVSEERVSPRGGSTGAAGLYAHRLARHLRERDPKELFKAA